MFNIGLPEFFLFGLVAIVFIGPERLPTVARWMGKQVGRLRRAWNEVQSEMSQDDDLREIQNASRQLRHELKSVRQEFTGVGDSVRKPETKSKSRASGGAEDDEWEILKREGLFDMGFSPSKDAKSDESAGQQDAPPENTSTASSDEGEA